ncbi:MAG: MBL fold metallo-hydrolase [Mycobacteriaceae bacterium]|nr:MBL fold metallo-hydrolase [Mycobacteriaceae bacterium]
MGLAHPAYGQLRPVTPSAAVLLANNPSSMTLEGTNTWVLRAPGRSDCVIVDPGPADRGHTRLLTEVGPIAMTLITHHHPDHVGALKRFVPLTGSPVRSVDPRFLNRSMHPLRDGEVIEAAGLRIRVLATPGHTTDSVSFVVDDDEGHKALLTGDTLLGRGTTVLGGYDGALSDYLAALDRLVEAGAGRVMLPAHGPELPDAGEVARQYRTHRRERLDQVRAALRALGKTPAEAKPLQVVRHVYKDVDKRLWPAARVSVKAQLAYLQDEA